MQTASAQTPIRSKIAQALSLTSICMLTFFGLSAQAVESLKVYIASNGNNARDGLSTKTAVLTLSRAQEIVRQQTQTPRNVEVLIGPGVYYKQSVKWTYTMAKHSILIRAQLPDRSRPRFDGCVGAGSSLDCTSETFFTLVPLTSSIPRGQVHLQDLWIYRYRGAITLGQKLYPTANNSITRVRFQKIGNSYNPKLLYGYSAVGLQNATKNTIRDCSFEDIVNVLGPETPRNVGEENLNLSDVERLIHGVYMSHGASENSILYNTFHTISGHAVKVRNSSNLNKIWQNDFTKINAGAFQDWYSRTAKECPSWGNNLRYNFFNGNYSCQSRLLVAEILEAGLESKYSNICEPAPAEATARLSTAGNEHSAAPCSI